ncbi:ABC transporter ATP-binding protein [Taklimakanibacter albus]|uniref:ABC transporter ATP-binding protein n=1 Tax=Taklimakanibacter albus TaxID=2800327 RepID=A0ACC5QXF6_9HYPH|nr:ABC transporter ATP-binding protein [Aestuariivirga sp. YIM B02566]MBK1865069.1 ABC transporter ATP-binding protein [Aestuariivirga sp. YIM B02566]
MSDKPLLDIKGLDVSYHLDGDVYAALRDIGLTVTPGEIVGVVGESGCGKSTLSASLLRLLPGNAEIDRGEAWLKGRDMLRLGEEELRRLRGRDIAMIFQDPMQSLNPTFRIGSQMAEAWRSHQARGAKFADFHGEAVKALTSVGIPDAAERMASYPHEFSGGMRQRISIATALLLQPSILVADEPTSALDVTLEAQILELLKQLREDHGTAIVYVSHDLGTVAELCDRVIVMYAGRVVEENDAAALFDNPSHPYTRALIDCIPSRTRRGAALATIPGRVPSLSALPPGCKFAERCTMARGICSEEEPGLVPQAGGGVRCHMFDPAKAEAWRIGDQAPESVAAPPFKVSVKEPEREALIEVRDLRKHFGEATGFVGRLLSVARPPVRAIDGINLTIRRGEVVGLVGESGSGKTTLGEVMLRLQAATSGGITFAGKDLRQIPERDFRRRVQMIFQDPQASLSPRQRVAALLTEPYRIHGIAAEEQQSVDALLAMVGLSADLAAKFPHQLSGGQARRVGIARALALKPDFIVADEPTAGLDVSAASAILNLMRDLQQELGLTFLIITHNINLIAYMAHRIAVMYLGQIVEIGPTEAVFDRPAHPYSASLLSLTSQIDAPERKRGRLLVPGEIPSPRNPPAGCRFHTRCVHASERCRSEAPTLETAGHGHEVACHFWRHIDQEKS